MLIYNSDGWFEYRSLTESNIFCHSFTATKKEVQKRFGVNLYELLN